MKLRINEVINSEPYLDSYLDSNSSFNEDTFNKNILFDDIYDFLRSHNVPIDDFKANISVNQDDYYEELDVYCKFSWIIYVEDLDKSKFPSLCMKLEQKLKTDTNLNFIEEPDCVWFSDSEYTDNGFDFELRFKVTYKLDNNINESLFKEIIDLTGRNDITPKIKDQFIKFLYDTVSPKEASDLIKSEERANQSEAYSKDISKLVYDFADKFGYQFNHRITDFFDAYTTLRDLAADKILKNIAYEEFGYPMSYLTNEDVESALRPIFDNSLSYYAGGHKRGRHQFNSSDYIWILFTYDFTSKMQHDFPEDNIKSACAKFEIKFTPKGIEDIKVYDTGSDASGYLRLYTYDSDLSYYYPAPTSYHATIPNKYIKIMQDYRDSEIDIIKANESKIIEGFIGILKNKLNN